jgi:hypothetical protein
MAGEALKLFDDWHTILPCVGWVLHTPVPWQDEA